MTRLRASMLVGLLALWPAGGCGGHPAAPQTPAPTPTPTPVSAPTPEPTPAEIYGCGLPRGKGLGRSCPRLNPSFQAEVEAAIERVIEEHPDYSFSDQYQILSSDGFIIRGLASYRATCFPAWDAIPPAGDDS